MPHEPTEGRGAFQVPDTLQISAVCEKEPKRAQQDPPEDASTQQPPLGPPPMQTEAAFLSPSRQTSVALLMLQNIQQSLNPGTAPDRWLWGLTRVSQRHRSPAFPLPQAPSTPIPQSHPYSFSFASPSTSPGPAASSAPAPAVGADIFAPRSPRGSLLAVGAGPRQEGEIQSDGAGAGGHAKRPSPAGWAVLLVTLTYSNN